MNPEQVIKINPFKPHLSDVWRVRIATAGKRKYATTNTISVYLRCLRGVNIDLPMLTVRDGWLTIKKGFIFDGASGPAIDGPANLLAAVIHDSLYVIKNLLGKHAGYSYGDADKVYRRILKVQGGGNGLAKSRAWLHWGVLRGLGWVPRLRLLFGEDEMQQTPYEGADK